MDVFRNGPDTARLSMRAMTVEDAASFLALNSNPIVMRYTHEPLVESLEEATEMLASYPDYDSVGYGRWGCFLKESGRMIGFCGLKYLSDRDEVDVGFRFLPEYWGRGLATEASRASVAFGFEKLGLDRIAGLVLPENLASIRVLEKSGLRHEGEFVDEGLRVLQYGVYRGDAMSQSA